MMPSDVPEEFLESWGAFEEVCGNATGFLKEEAFRILLKQAGVKQKTRGQLKDFCKLKPYHVELMKQVYLKYLLYHLLPQQHSFKIALQVNQMQNISHGFSISGQMILKPQKFEMAYLINRMKSLKVLDDIPFEARTLRSAKPRDFILLKGTENTELWLGRTKKTLLFRYNIKSNTKIPAYPDLEKQIYASWRQLTLGEFK